jgi:hypothetical protein
MSVCGPSRHFAASQQFGRFRGEADISGGLQNRNSLIWCGSGSEVRTMNAPAKNDADF